MMDMKHARTDCNPSWDHAERQARDWAARVGLVTTDRDRRRLAKMGQGRMAGWLAPHADPGELALLAQWGAFIALVDDTYDRDSQAGPAQVDDLMDRLVAVVTHSSVDHDTSIPAVRALVDLWSRSVAGAARGWAARFAEHYRRFADLASMRRAAPGTPIRTHASQPGRSSRRFAQDRTAPSATWS